MKDYTPFNQTDFNRWRADKGDYTVRLNYPLNENSVVVDAGGFMGEWADEIHRRYKSAVYIFEPVDEFYNSMVQKFDGNEKIKVFKFGLSNRNETLEIYHSKDGSSVYGGGKGTETIQLRDFREVYKELNLSHVDLLKINIEGGEFDLMDGIIESDLQKSIDNFQIQYHRFIKGCVERRDKIRSVLGCTHRETYNYEFIWENWKLK